MYVYLLFKHSSIYMQPLTPSVASCYFKDCLPGSVLQTLLSSGFSCTSLLALSPLKHRKHHSNESLSPVVFGKVRFLGFFCFSSTLLHSAHSPSILSRI